MAGGLSGSIGYTLDGALHTNRYDNLSLPLDVVTESVAQPAIGVAFGLGVGLGREHFQFHDLVARRRTRQAAPAQAQLAAGF